MFLLDHAKAVLGKFDDATHAFKIGSREKFKCLLEEDTQLVERRIKAIKLAEKSKFGWLTVNEYLSDELASDSEEEKRIYRSERRAEKKVKNRQRPKKITA